MLLVASIRSMIRKLVTVIMWFPLALMLLVVNLTFIHSSKSNHQASAGQLLGAHIESTSDLVPIVIASDSNTSGVISTSVVSGDARELLLSDFLQSHQSPMSDYAHILVSEADKNSIDFRIVTAIAMCESNLGKRIPSSGSFNAWGIAVYTGQKSGAKFTDWNRAISWVSSYVRQRYYDQGITELEDIGAIWAPPSVETGNSWANCVREFKTSIY